MLKLSEGQIVNLWRQLSPRQDLVTEDGEPLQVIYPGRANDGRGADFRDAVIACRRGLLYGDIEVHVKASAWRAHRHHRDLTYNRVILHVVMYDDSGTAMLVHGGTAPVIVLEKYLEEPADSGASGEVACRNSAGRFPDEVSELLVCAGRQRFREKAERFGREITGQGAGQSLYRGIMGALGYAKNQIPFLELAERLPLDTLEPAGDCGSADRKSGVSFISGKMLGAAGFLPPPGGVRAMSLKDWELCRVRPRNSPVRRIMAFSHLLWRCRKKGLLQSMLGLVREAPAEHCPRWLEAGLTVTDESGSGAGTLLGRARAADIAVNVLLPFTCAWGQLHAEPDLAEKVAAIYESYRRLSSNAIEKHMRAQLGLDGSQVDSACKQQGLLYLYRTRCTQGECGSCQLSILRPATTSRSSPATLPARNR